MTILQKFIKILVESGDSGVYMMTGFFLTLLIAVFTCSFTNSFLHAAAQTSDTCQKLPISSITANADDVIHHPATPVDNNLKTRWSNFGLGSWIQVDLGAQMTICSVASITELAVNGFSSTSPQPPPVSQPTTGILLPLYIYPQVELGNLFPIENAYEKLANIAKAHPSVGITAIINPNSGPGTTQNIDFIRGISILTNAGIRVIGYVYTSYGSRPIASVEADIDRYISFYGSSISGVLFDEMSNTPGNANYYKTLSNYAKSKGLAFTAGNPGIDTLPGYIGTVDTMTIYEGSGVPILNYLGGGWHSNYGKQNFNFVAYGVASLDQAYITSAAKYVGYMYITNDNLPNPWNTLPPYLEQIVTILEGTK